MLQILGEFQKGKQRLGLMSHTLKELAQIAQPFHPEFQERCEFNGKLFV
jgi:hypothetical protein